MNVSVKEALAFRTAQAATSKQDFQKVFTGVLIRPDGMVAGTDGFVLAYHPHTVEPFDGEPFIANLERALPKTARNITLDTESQVVTYTTHTGKKSKRHAMAYEVIEATFPDFERFAPTNGVEWSGDEFALNFDHVKRVWSVAMPGNPHVRWRFLDERGKMVRLSAYDPEMVLLMTGSNL